MSNFFRQAIMKRTKFHRRARSISPIAQLVCTFFAALPCMLHAQVQEYKWWALKVKADRAHLVTNFDTSGQQSGKGITLAVVDTGVARHGEFGSRLLSGFDYWGGNGQIDPAGHGTHVTGIAAAALNGSGVAGVAPEAWILPVRVLNASGSGSITSFDAGVKWAIDHHVRPVGGTPTQKTIFNMSLAGSSAFGLATLQRVRNAGSIGVLAAGNEGRSDPAYPGRYVSDASVAGWIIAVGAVDAANKLASFSNRAGSARNYFLVAPGAGIESVVPGGTTITRSGTSMAAPMVSGAAAQVWGAWPYLRGDTVVDSLLRSATDLGTEGVDPIYGWGLLNVQAAMAPIGDTCMPTSTNSCGVPGAPPGLDEPERPGPENGRSGSRRGRARTRSLSVPAAAGVAVAESGARVAGYDSLGRHFFFPVAVLLRAGGVNAARNMDAWLSRSEPVNYNGAPANRLAMQGDVSRGVTALSLRQDISARSYLMMFNGAAVLPFGDSHAEALSNSFAGDALKIPYLGLMESPTGAAYGTTLRRGSGSGIGIHDGLHLGLRLGLITGAKAGADRISEFVPVIMPRIRSNAALAEVSARLGGFEIIGTLGALGEGGSFLGAASSHVRTSAETAFYSMSAVHQFGGGLSALASYSQGKSSGRTDDKGATYAANTRAYSIGLLKRAFLNTDDRLALSVTMPARVTRGDVTVNAAVDVDLASGAPIFGNVPVSLAPLGRERRFELTWGMAVRSGSVALSAMHRIQPDHDVRAASERLVGIRYTQAF